ncbi:hypothetical protein V8C86DRAFT_2795790 [Haematococcus lacustris]
MKPRAFPRAPQQLSASVSWQQLATVFAVLYSLGYLVGFLTKDSLFSGGLVTSGSAHARSAVLLDATHKWKGDTVHTVFTSSGDAYQNFQSRIMYATYKLVQQQPGGERLTGFTRILHRTVPDVLMDEIPTFHTQPLKPQCDGWCDYPVANRPPAIKAFFDAVRRNESMIQGAWVFMLEADYVWMQPMQVPGDAWDRSVPGVQFLYDYIMPAHPNAAPQMKKLYAGNVSDIPASGPAPVLMRLQDWYTITEDYVAASRIMEGDQEMKSKLEWVREMYAWDVAVAKHRDLIPMRTEHPPESTTIVQPPFDEGLDRAALCHYTWGALYHEGLPSQGVKPFYKWEKRDYNNMAFVLKVPNIPMPPEYKDGWILEFDAPLNRKRHDLVVLMLTQMNKAINQLPDLTEHWKMEEPKISEMIRARDAAEAEAKKAAKSTSKRRFLA